MTDHCPVCCVQLRQSTWKNRPERYRVDSPWGPLYELWTGRCFNCGNKVRSVVRDFDPVPVNWIDTSELLREGKDYQIPYKRKGPGIGIDRSQTDVLWYWHPLGNDLEWLSKALSVFAKQVEKSPNQVIVVIAGNMASMDICAKVGQVKQIWRLADAVTQDAVGPHPSIRAELSLWKTFSSHLNLGSIFHCWPGASLNKCDYLPMMGLEDLAAAWAIYQRRNLNVTITKDKK